MTEHLILLTNDDGVNAPGLLALRSAVAELGRVEVFAPERNWSAASRTRTFHKPLRVDQVQMLDGSKAFVTSGTPSDCVSLALLGLLGERPSLLVSGINAGLNLGRDVSYSGTVAAAMEGVRGGIPSIAISFDTLRGDSDTPDYGAAAKFAERLARYVLGKPNFPRGILLNVNVPDLSGRPLRMKTTRLGGDAYSNYLVSGRDPHGRSYYWVTGEPRRSDPKEEHDTDISAVADGFVSITPIHLDMTEHSLIEELRSWEPDLSAGE